MKNYHILIVDDQYEHLDFISQIIESNSKNYELYEALNVKNALKIIGKESIDLIITDWEMPEMNGIEFISQIKQNEKTKDIPVIMCTGIMTSSDNLKAALEAGATDYIRKPVDQIELLARINSMLKLSDSVKETIEQKEIIFKKEKQIIEQKNELLEQENKFKDKELFTKTIQLVSINEFLVDISEDIKVITKDYPLKIRKDFVTIKSKIRAKLSDTFWREFEIEMNLVKNNFYEKLNLLFPNLTVKEKRLCSLLILNFSTKEIANLLVQSPKSIDMARYRLRQKFNLDINQNLTTFLLKLLEN
jgi:DNA-binding response OmpR family regulator